MKTIKYATLLLLLAACSSPTTPTGSTGGKLESFEGKWVHVGSAGDILAIGDSAGALTAAIYDKMTDTLVASGVVSHSARYGWQEYTIDFGRTLPILYKMDSSNFRCDWTPDTLYMNRGSAVNSDFVRQ